MLGRPGIARIAMLLSITKLATEKEALMTAKKAAI